MEKLENIKSFVKNTTGSMSNQKHSREKELSWSSQKVGSSNRVDMCMFSNIYKKETYNTITLLSITFYDANWFIMKLTMV